MLKTAAFAAIAAALVSTPAAAAARDRAPQVGNHAIHLYNDDLAMNSAAGRAALLARVERAAYRLCRDHSARAYCVAAVVRDASRLPQGTPLRVAMDERNAVRVAAR